MIILFGSLITVDVMCGPDLNDPNIGVLYRNHINNSKDQNSTGGSNNELL